MSTDQHYNPEPHQKRANRVIIVGAGFSGLFTLKHCLEAGLDATIYEAKSYIGGVWDRRSGAILPSTETVSSRLYMGASDFPMDDTYPEFPLHSDVLRYIYSFADHFDLHKHIRLSCPVSSVNETDGGWEVTLANGECVCSEFIVLGPGLVNTPNIPADWAQYSGSEMWHSSEYPYRRQELKDLEEKRILIVGSSDSACDVAKDLFWLGARRIEMSSHEGTWFQDKSLGTTPADTIYSVFTDQLKRALGRDRFERLLLAPTLLSRQEAFWGKNGSGIKIWEPTGGYLASAYVKSRKVVEQLQNGSVQPVRGATPTADGKKVRLLDKHGQEQIRENFDLVILCTGFKHKPASALGLDRPELLQDLYRQTFSLENPTLAVVGNVRPYVTSIVTMIEFQSWRAATAFAKNDFPDREARAAEIESRRQEHQSEFPKEHSRLPDLVDPYDFTREVAEEIGVDCWWSELPVTEQLYFRWHSFWGTWTPSMYRMQSKPEVAKQQLQQVYETEGSKSISKHGKTMALFVALLLLLAVAVALSSSFCLLRTLSSSSAKLAPPTPRLDFTTAEHDSMIRLSHAKISHKPAEAADEWQLCTNHSHIVLCERRRPDDADVSALVVSMSGAVQRW